MGFAAACLSSENDVGFREEKLSCLGFGLRSTKISKIEGKANLSSLSSRIVSPIMLAAKFGGKAFLTAPRRGRSLPVTLPQSVRGEAQRALAGCPINLRPLSC